MFQQNKQIYIPIPHLHTSLCGGIGKLVEHEGNCFHLVSQGTQRSLITVLNSNSSKKYFALGMKDEGH